MWVFIHEGYNGEHTLVSVVIRGSLNSSDSIKLIELIWKTMIGSLERAFLLPILFYYTLYYY